MRKRKILLLEPGYKNKYPPIGLMKIASYHKLLDDEVIFHKGLIKEFIFELIVKECNEKLYCLIPNVEWSLYTEIIQTYIKFKRKDTLEEIKDLLQLKFVLNEGELKLLDIWLKHYSEYYRKKKYLQKPMFDRIYISTLFTFYWNITIKAVNEAKLYVESSKNLQVGGVLATVLADKFKNETGITPHLGLLDKPRLLGDDNEIIVDELPLDYSILDEIDYKYPERNAFYGYMTRGCIRKCNFCVVWKIEPKFKSYISIYDKIKKTKELYGEFPKLLLLDNNVLASPHFSKIIAEIKMVGFEKNAKYFPNNQLDLVVKNLKNSINDRAYSKKAFHLLIDFLNKLSGDEQQKFYNLLERNSLLNKYTIKKENILSLYPEIKDLYELRRSKIKRKRYVDFNQGIDARLVTDENMKLLGEICINPLRIAFDSIEYEEIYKNAVELAAKNEIRVLSNYLLYNEKDRPEDLYKRLEINIQLASQLDIVIYSFPMKYHPIVGDEKLNRDFLGQHWNRKYVRAIQTILNSTKGKVGRGKTFFYKAFGKDLEEYNKILLMPEHYILYRYFFEDYGYTDRWWSQYNNLNEIQKNIALPIIHSNNFQDLRSEIDNSVVRNFINEHYCLAKKDIEDPNSTLYIARKKYELTKKLMT